MNCVIVKVWECSIWHEWLIWPAVKPHRFHPPAVGQSDRRPPLPRQVYYLQPPASFSDPLICWLSDLSPLLPPPHSVAHVLPHRVSLPATHVFPVMDFSSQQRPLEQCFAAPLHMSQPPFVKSFVCCFLPTSGFLYERAKPFTVSTIGTTCTLPIIKTPHYSNLCCALLVLFTAAGESQSVSTVLMFGQTSPTCHGLFSTPATIVCACCVISLWTFR